MKKNTLAHVLFLLMKIQAFYTEKSSVRERTTVAHWKKHVFIEQTLLFMKKQFVHSQPMFFMRIPVFFMNSHVFKWQAISFHEKPSVLEWFQKKTDRHRQDRTGQNRTSRFRDLSWTRPGGGVLRFFVCFWVFRGFSVGFLRFSYLFILCEFFRIIFIGCFLVVPNLLIVNPQLS